LLMQSMKQHKFQCWYKAWNNRSFIADTKHQATEVSLLIQSIKKQNFIADAKHQATYVSLLILSIKQQTFHCWYKASSNRPSICDSFLGPHILLSAAKSPALLSSIQVKFLGCTVKRL
jgi:hypothetical protein